METTAHPADARRSIAEIVETRRDDLVQWLAADFGIVADAEDVIHDAVVGLLQRVDGPRPLVTNHWRRTVFAAVRLMALKHLERASYRTPSGGATPAGSTPPDLALDRRDLCEAIADRVVFGETLRRPDLPPASAAERLGISLRQFTRRRRAALDDARRLYA